MNQWNSNPSWWPQQRRKQHVETEEERNKRWKGMRIWRIHPEQEARMAHKQWMRSLVKLARAYQNEEKMRDSYERALELLNHPEEAYPKPRIKLTEEERAEIERRRRESTRKYQRGRTAIEWRRQPEQLAKKSEYDRKRRERLKNGQE